MRRFIQWRINGRGGNQMKTIHLLLASVLLVGTIKAQEKPNAILIQNAIIHTEDGIIENGVLGIRGDSIILVADARTVRIDKSAYGKIIEAEGKHVFPGFIALNSTVGLVEIESVRATLDFAEVGLLNPNIRSLASFNTDSRIIPTLRSNGILSVQVCPQAGLISGSSSVFRMNGWNWEDAVRYKDNAMHLNWPWSPIQVNPADTAGRNANRYLKQLAQLQEFFRDAKAYCSLEKPPSVNLKLEAMKPVFSGKSALFIQAEHARDISDAVNFAVSFGVPRIVIVGGAESAQVISLLKKHKVAVVLSRIHKLPETPDRMPQEEFKLPALLTQSGITVALSYSGEMEAMGTRNLGFIAGTAAAYGLSWEEALKLISLNPAKILAIDNKEGSIKVGKKASFFISSGNALDMMESNVQQVFIDGVETNTDTDQKELYKKYMEKYGLK
jgi:imidazolonepropionase-like amidohydrolase